MCTCVCAAAPAQTSIDSVHCNRVSFVFYAGISVTGQSSLSHCAHMARKLLVDDRTAIGCRLRGYATTTTGFYGLDELMVCVCFFSGITVKHAVKQFFFFCFTSNADFDEYKEDVCCIFARFNLTIKAPLYCVSSRGRLISLSASRLHERTTPRYRRQLAWACCWTTRRRWQRLPPQRLDADL